MSDTPVTPISERQIGTDHDRAIIAAMERIALAGEYPIDVIVDYFDPTAPIGSSLRQFSDFGLRALAEVERLTTAQRCCRGCPDCMGIGGRNQIIGQAAEIERQAQVIAERDATIAELRQAVVNWDWTSQARGLRRDEIADYLVSNFHPDRPYFAVDHILDLIAAGDDAVDEVLFAVIPEDKWGMTPPWGESVRRVGLPSASPEETQP